jgi:hypothetical protein
LALSAVALRLGAPQRETFPSALSFQAGGTKAYSDLLASMGYRVEISREDHPKLDSDAVAVIFRPWAREVAKDMTTDEDSSPQEKPDPLYGARKAVVIAICNDFEATAKSAEAGAPGIVSPLSASSPVQVSLGLELSPEDADPDTVLPRSRGEGDGTVIWKTAGSGAPFAQYERVGDREQIYVSDGIGATNRYITRLDNAAVFTGLIRPLAKPGGTIVFIEDSVGNSIEPSLLGLIGPWALCAWWQIVLLAIVVVYTVGKRFGIPDAVRYRQRGTRELVEAVADLYKRGHATHVATAAVVAECDRLVRQACKLSRDAPRTSRDALLPDSLAKAFALCEAAAGGPVPSSEGLRLARRLEAETYQFLGTATRRSRPRRIR